MQRVEIGQTAIQLTLKVAEIPLVLMEREFPMQLQRRGVEMRLVVAAPAANTRSDPDLLKRLRQAFRWWEQIASGQVSTTAAIATAEGLDPIYVGRVLPLALLAPDIVESITKGEQPAGLTAVKMMKGHGETLPLTWADQRKFLGFAPKP